MLDLRVHFLEADGSLALWREQILREVRETIERVDGQVPVSEAVAPIDIIVERRPNEVIPELGLTASCYRRGLISLTLDPDNGNFEDSLAAGELLRTLTHELHHSFRYSTCGYGARLGEALVTEGLADAFDDEINGGEGRLWGHAIAAGAWEQVLDRAERELWADSYDHAGWFYGDDRALPRWAGHTIGYHLVKTYLAVNPEARASQMAATPATVVIGEAWAPLRERMLAAA